MSTHKGTTPCELCPLRGKKGYRTFNQDELQFVRSFKTGEMRIAAGTPFLVEGQSSPHLFTIMSGWAVRFKSFSDGKRQILNFALSGDLLGLHASLFQEMTHSVDALTDVVLCTFSRQRLWELYNNHPSLAFDITWLASREEQVLGTALAAVGRRSAFHRIAAILLMVFDRARMAGLVTSDNRLVLPLTQEHLADATGLSIVHTNKTLKRLRATGWIQWDRNQLTVVDDAKLRELVEEKTGEPSLRPYL